MTDTLETTPRENTPRQRPAWEDIAILVIGLWLMFCPPTLGLNVSIVDTTSTVIAGLVLTILGSVSMRTNWEWVEWATIAAGGVLLVMPWALGFALKTAVVNATASGVAALVLAGWRAYALRSKATATTSEMPSAAPAIPAIGDGKRPRKAA